MPSGTTTINFGAWPGSGRAQATVSGQTGLVSTSRVEAWVHPTPTASHSADEHRSVDLKVRGYYVSDGVLRVEGFSSALPSLVHNRLRQRPHRLHGIYTVGWAWSNT